MSMDGDGEEWGDMEMDDDELGAWGDEGEGWDDGDEDDVGMWSGEEPTTALPNASKDTPYKILDSNEIQRQMAKKVEDVADILDIGEDEAAIFLRHFRWNQSRLVEKFVDRGRGVMRLEYGLSAEPELKVDPITKGEIECPQCLDDVDAADAFFIQVERKNDQNVKEIVTLCGHQSCKNCWRDYLADRVKEGPRSVLGPCNYHQCQVIVPDAAYDELLSPKQAKHRRTFLLRSFVEGSKTLAWCPAPGCELAASCSQGGAYEILCKCGTYFCFGCHDYSHRPAPCDWASKWRIKSNSEAENATWILANTKACPRCNVQIEKNQGCNHMTCRGCKHEFCWLCKGDWSSHGSATGGYYKCNLYEESKAKGETSDEEKHADKAKNDLQKYLHYFQRFDNHDKAMKYAQRTLQECDDKMRELQELKGGGFNDVQFLIKAVQQVIECRRLLKWTYCFGYYKEAGLEKQLFESLQRDLEKYTEHLHELSEKPIEDLLNDDMRATVINYTRVTNKFREQMMNGIENGLTEASV